MTIPCMKSFIVTMHYALDHFQLQALRMFDLSVGNHRKEYIDRPASVFSFGHSFQIYFVSSIMLYWYTVHPSSFLISSIHFWSIIQFPVTAMSKHTFDISVLSVFPSIRIQHSEPNENSSCGFILNNVMQYLIIVVSVFHSCNYWSISFLRYFYIGVVLIMTLPNLVISGY